MPTTKKFSFPFNLDRPVPSLHDRIGRLIHHFFGGNLNAAAHAWGIPQPTLHRIVEGTTKSPRVDLLAKIAAAHSTTIEWLFTGEGEEPQWARQTMGRMAPVTGQVLAWTKLLDRLNLQPQVKDSLIEAVFGPWWMYSTLAAEETEESRESQEQVREAVERSAHAWTTALLGLLESFPEAVVKQALERHADDARLWFNPFGLWLKGAGVLPNGLSELYDRYLEYEKRCNDAELGAKLPISKHVRAPVRLTEDKARLTKPPQRVKRPAAGGGKSA